MNAQEKATAALLRLKEFICHISQNYLCWCQLYGIGAERVAWWEERWKRGTAREKLCKVHAWKKNERKKEMHSFHTSFPHKLLPHPLLPIITSFAHCELQESGKAPFAPASYFAGGLDVSERNTSSSVGLNLFSPQCGGWKDVYYDSWRSVVMKEGCGVR